MKRGTALALILGVVVAAAGGGWLAGRNITSPAEAAARAQPPEPSLITVAVEQTALSADVIARGDIVFDDPVSVSLSGATGESEVPPVVTKLPEQGAELAEGALMVEVVGRPVFLMQGLIPVYRDLRPGAEGIDVLQFEEALARLGYLSESPDEVWTSATGAAVQAMYDEAGYRANAADESELASLDSARDRVRLAGQGVTAAENDLSSITGAAQSDILDARAQVSSADDGLELAKVTRDGANAAAARELTNAEAAAADAVAAAEEAAARLAEAEAGTHPDTGLPPTPDELAVLREEDVAARSERAAAESTAAAAAQAVTETKVAQDSAVRQAESALAIAKARLDEVLSPPDRSSLRAAVDAAREELANAREDLAELEASVGTWVPAGEIVFLERVPVRVDQLAVTLGGTISGPFVTVSGSEIALRMQVQESDAARLTVGDTVFVDEDVLEEPLEGVISSIAERGTGGRVAVEVVLETVPEELVGANVKVVIPIESTAGEVLAVPAAALSAVADGSVRVEVEDEPGVTRFVTVETGLAAGGLVEITPIDGEIQPGARVVVGQADGGSSDPGEADNDEPAETAETTADGDA
jgi:hypothetical protein